MPGRRCKYNETFDTIAEGLARQGVTDASIAKALGISTRVFYEYQKRFPQFRHALARGRQPINFEMENLLLKKARGFELTDRYIETDENGNPVKQKVWRRQIPPETGAILEWLSHKMPEVWGRKIEVDSVTRTVPPADNAKEAAKIIENMTFEEREKYLDKLLGVKP